MQIALPFTEALAVAASQKLLPPMLSGIHCEGSTVHAEVDLRAIPDPSTALRFAAAAAGTVAVTARFAGYADGVVTLVVTAHARTLPAHKLLPYLLGPINAMLREQGLPEGLVEIQRGESEPWVLIDVQQAVATKADGVTVTALGLRNAVIHVDVALGNVRLR
jgi:hypothetical protein